MIKNPAKYPQTNTNFVINKLLNQYQIQKKNTNSHP